MSNISDEISTIEFTSLSENMMSISTQLDLLLLSMKNEEGSLGKLIYNDSLYNELNNTLQSMDQLLIDIRENPKKYVNISLWGSDKKSEK